MGWPRRTLLLVLSHEKRAVPSCNTVTSRYGAYYFALDVHSCFHSATIDERQLADRNGAIMDGSAEDREQQLQEEYPVVEPAHHGYFNKGGTMHIYSVYDTEYKPYGRVVQGVEYRHGRAKSDPDRFEDHLFCLLK